ncbi:MAG TPA: hypothetical protein VFM18_10070 [Methanosarcina sp.]|nr:hypothetical protein [Methanosarcina sp.]
MLYSPTAHSTGGNGFFFEGDPNAPVDSFSVSNSDAQKAQNLPSGSVYSFSLPTGSKVGVLSISAAVPTAAQVQQQLQQQAMVALTITDKVAYRCFKAGVPFPANWQTYTIALRAIVNGTDTTSTSLPIQPSYPKGT